MVVLGSMVALAAGVEDPASPACAVTASAPLFALGGLGLVAVGSLAGNALEGSWATAGEVLVVPGVVVVGGSAVALTAGSVACSSEVVRASRGARAAGVPTRERELAVVALTGIGMAGLVGFGVAAVADAPPETWVPGVAVSAGSLVSAGILGEVTRHRLAVAVAPAGVGVRGTF